MLTPTHRANQGATIPLLGLLLLLAVLVPPCLPLILKKSLPKPNFRAGGPPVDVRAACADH